MNIQQLDKRSLTESFLVDDVQENRVRKYLGGETYDYISKFVDFDDEGTKVIETSSAFNIDLINDPVANIVNIKRVNFIRFLNKFFEAVNKKLPHGGLFIGKGETIMERRKTIYKKFPKYLAPIFYFLDFVFHRVLPKWTPTKKLYFLLTKGNNRVLSKAEILGRVISCGFEIVEEAELNNKLIFVARKVKEPAFDKSPSYGPLFKMRRVGKNGKTIHVYKLRTMHPYSEYLQEYMFNKYNLKKGGKLANDFRITNWGKLMRKLWVDEFPMFINFFKGELKLVGVRPLSFHFFGLYNEELKKKRLKTKPGLIPPFYADLPKTLGEVMQSEERYLDSYEKHPIWTDFKYFWLAMYNIFVKRARSA
ncbi:MAG: hypothetical protein SCALA702_33640 [Melioribacteraceae bacterium]|nr:MAG: hypothetical protein SCALA702_33640 [Melioribacteraceae bacterium]